MAADSYSKNQAGVTIKTARRSRRKRVKSRRGKLSLRTAMTIDGPRTHRLDGKSGHEDVLTRDEIASTRCFGLCFGLGLMTTGLPASRVEREQRERRHESVGHRHRQRDWQ